MEFPELFENTFGPIHHIPVIYPNGVSLLTPMHFRVPSLIFGPPVANCLAENGVSGSFEKAIGSFYFIPAIYPYGVNLLTPRHYVFLASFRPSGGQIFGRKWVSGTFWKKTNYWLNSCHTWHLSIWGQSIDPYTFPSLIFSPLVAKYLVKNGVYGIFWKNYWFHSLHIWQLPFGCESLDPYLFSCSYPHFRPSGGQIFGGNWGLGIFFNYWFHPLHTWQLPFGDESLDPYSFLCS